MRSLTVARDLQRAPSTRRDARPRAGRGFAKNKIAAGRRAILGARAVTRDVSS
jgi:hypothetical protein